MKAWHFLKEHRILQYGDGRVVEVGKTYECKGEIILCQNGMHASVNIIDALKYATGPILCRVELEDDLKIDTDKIAGRKRTVLAMEDISTSLHLFAIDCAERALSKIDNPDPRLIKALEVKKKWMKGGVTDEELREAREGAWDVAWAAAEAAWDAAAWDAAASAWEVAAWDAAASAWEAAMEAAMEAAEAAAWAAAAAAEAQIEEKEKQEEVLLSILKENHPNLFL